jgi:hypothetical protein
MTRDFDWRVAIGVVSASMFAWLAMASVSTATFTVDGVATRPRAAVATIQPRTGAPGYSWLRIFFYPSAAAADRAAATHGRDLTKTTWSAVLQFTVDKAGTIWQIDLSVPGHTCTIAETDRDAKAALQEFQLDRRSVRLRGMGKHVCDMRSLKIPDQTFQWDVDLDLPLATVTP